MITNYKNKMQFQKHACLHMRYKPMPVILQSSGGDISAGQAPIDRSRHSAPCLDSQVLKQSSVILSVLGMLTAGNTKSL